MAKRDEAQAEPVQRIRAEGEEGGHPELVFDREARQWFWLNTLRERVWVGCPEGYSYDDDGRLIEAA